MYLCIGCVSFAIHKKKELPKTYSGGETTVFITSRDAFAKNAANLPTEKVRDFTFGNRLFNTKWVTAPASVTTFDGLGPTFNQKSCSACHFKDGRGRPPKNRDEPFKSMLIRLSVPGESDHGGPKPHPLYGGQLNNKSIHDVPNEGHAYITYTEKKEYFADGEAYSLRIPQYHFEDMNFGELDESVMFSPRVAPAVFGLGLLEAINENTILSFADPDDRNQDGISGRPNYVYDQQRGEKALGRFGWKANEPTLKQQAAGAFLGDIGITTSLNPDENCPDIQAQCQSKPHGGTPEVNNEFLEKLNFYLSTLAVPARRDVDDEQVVHGEKIFMQANCYICHVPKMTTGSHDIPQLTHQTIRPYTDLLLHDMGEGLADNRPDYEANDREWRTPPKWGIGLQKTVNQHTFFLHDGRARNLTEAIMWHGGEAEASREFVRTLSKEDRKSLLTFLNSL
ncbi:MAG: thiol oxidoreductase [Candidatus Omnitrophica bacterium]|nr:thiol oxidoreductase [Candidatus Omnitrophota bacterium]